MQSACWWSCRWPRLSASAADARVVEGVVLVVSVVEAVERDLAKLPPDIAESALGATALALARELDSGSSATSKSMCAKALLDTFDKLRELAPPEEKKGTLHDIRAKRSLRLASGGADS